MYLLISVRTLPFNFRVSVQATAFLTLRIKYTVTSSFMFCSAHGLEIISFCLICLTGLCHWRPQIICKHLLAAGTAVKDLFYE
jgi:hypothetical protein